MAACGGPAQAVYGRSPVLLGAQNPWKLLQHDEGLKQPRLPSAACGALRLAEELAQPASTSDAETTGLITPSSSSGGGSSSHRCGGGGWAGPVVLSLTAAVPEPTTPPRARAGAPREEPVRLLGSPMYVAADGACSAAAAVAVAAPAEAAVAAAPAAAAGGGEARVKVPLSISQALGGGAAAGAAAAPPRRRQQPPPRPQPPQRAAEAARLPRMALSLSDALEEAAPAAPAAAAAAAAARMPLGNLPRQAASLGAAAWPPQCAPPAASAHGCLPLLGQAEASAGSEGGSSAEADRRLGAARRHFKQRRLWVHFHLHMQAPGFDLVAGLIGRGGRRVRAIADATHAKVRIRGRGSGHLEVDGVSEAPAPLMVAVTSDHDDVAGFRAAVSMVLKELQNSEQRYKLFCRKHCARTSVACYSVGAMADGVEGVLGDLIAGIP